jgi:hypothetical protein
MSEGDIERLGNRPVRNIQVPDYFLEGSEAKPMHFTSKEIETKLPENTAWLHDFTERTKLCTLSLADGLLLPEENSEEDFWCGEGEFKGVRFFQLNSLHWSRDRKITSNNSLQIVASTLRPFDIKPGIYYAMRNAKLPVDVRCYNNAECYSRREDGLCKRGGCRYIDGDSEDKVDNNIWHLAVDFRSPIEIV